MNIKNNLKSLLAEGRIRQVVEQILELSKVDSDMHNEAVALSARFRKYNQEKHGNISSPDELNIELNRIQNAALDLIDRLPEKASVKKQWFADRRNWLIGAGIAVLLVLARLFFPFPGGEKLDKGGVVSTPAQTALDSTELSFRPDSNVVIPDVGHTNIPSSYERDNSNGRQRVSLSVNCTTDQVTDTAQYRRGEVRHLFYSVNKPNHYVRGIYQLADNTLILLTDNHFMTDSLAGQYIHLGSYQVDKPFGIEKLYVFARSKKFSELNTSQNVNGVTLIKDGLDQVIAKIKANNFGNTFAEKVITIQTSEE